MAGFILECMAGFVGIRTQRSTETLTATHAVAAGSLLTIVLCLAFVLMLLLLQALRQMFIVRCQFDRWRMKSRPACSRWRKSVPGVSGRWHDD